jgi:hypothetical protein
VKSSMAPDFFIAPESVMIPATRARRSSVLRRQHFPDGLPRGCHAGKASARSARHPPPPRAARPDRTLRALATTTSNKRRQGSAQERVSAARRNPAFYGTDDRSSAALSRQGLRTAYGASVVLPGTPGVARNGRRALSRVLGRLKEPGKDSGLLPALIKFAISRSSEQRPRKIQRFPADHIPVARAASPIQIFPDSQRQVPDGSAGASQTK